MSGIQMSSTFILTSSMPWAWLEFQTKNSSFQARFNLKSDKQVKRLHSIPLTRPYLLGCLPLHQLFVSAVVLLPRSPRQAYLPGRKKWFLSNSLKREIPCLRRNWTAMEWGMCHLCHSVVRQNCYKNKNNNNNNKVCWQTDHSDLCKASKGDLNRNEPKERMYNVHICGRAQPIAIYKT